MNVKISNMARFSSESGELSNINSCRARKWEIDNFKIKIVIFIENFGKTLSLEMVKYKPQNESSVSEV